MAEFLVIRLGRTPDEQVEWIVVDDEDERITFVNPAMEKLLGLPVDKIIGKRADEIFASSALGDINEVDDPAFEGKIVKAVKSIYIGEDLYTFDVLQMPLRMKNGAN